MSEQIYELTTDQAEREASGAHSYGRYLEEFEVGAVYKHWPAKTVTEADDHLFCLITMNHHPLHLNDVYAKGSQQGRNVVVGPLVYSLALGMSVSDVSGKAIANLATEDLSHPNPVFHGDTLYCETEVLEVKPSQSKPDRGVVKVHTRVLNQDGVLVAEFKRLVLVPRRDDRPSYATPLSQNANRDLPRRDRGGGDDSDPRNPAPAVGPELDSLVEEAVAGSPGVADGAPAPVPALNRHRRGSGGRGCDHPTADREPVAGPDRMAAGPQRQTLGPALG